METRTKNEAVATHLTYDRSGVLTGERKTARQFGTTVTVKKLFSNLPVRCKEFRRNIRKEYGKLITLLNVSHSVYAHCFYQLIVILMLVFNFNAQLIILVENPKWLT